MTDKRIKSVTVFQNGMAMVFDQSGQQMPEYQGLWSEVRDKVTAAYDGEIVGAVWPSARA